MRPAARKPINREVFGTITVLAVIVAALMVLMAAISASGAMVDKLPAKSASLKTTSAKSTSSTPASTFTVINTSMGSATAPVTIMVFSEFQCSHCQLFAQTIEKELEAAYVDTGDARVIYRFITAYEESLLANQAAACAAEQGKFWPYYYLLMQQEASPHKQDLPREKLEGLAQQLGLDMTMFKNSLESGKYEAKIWQEDDDARALGVKATPTFFINGTKMVGTKSLRDFQVIIDPMLSRSGS